MSVPDLETRKNLLWLYLPILIALLTLLIIWLLDMNVALFHRINQISGWTGTQLWQFLTIMGDGMISALLIAFWIKYKPEIAWSFIIATVIYLLLLNFLKDYFDFKRPPALLEPETFYLAGKAYMKRSFPSGHTTTIFALCGVISFYYRSDKVRTLALIIAILVGFSRVMIGVHWPADVFGGAILGWFSAGIGIYLSKRSCWGYSKLVKYSLSTLFFITAIVLVFQYETGYPAAVLMQKFLGTFIICYLGFVYFLKDYIKPVISLIQNLENS